MNRRHERHILVIISLNSLLWVSCTSLNQHILPVDNGVNEGETFANTLTLSRSSHTGTDYVTEQREVVYLNYDNYEIFQPPLHHIEVTSPFGPRWHPILGENRMHRGVDFAGGRNTVVISAASGIALMAGYCGPGEGNCVVIEHSDGWKSQYFHLSRVLVVSGAEITQGMEIGYVGATGRATGPHLHFQLSHNGEAVDPMTLIETQLEQ
jgi:murein DD-endopeptidase MepM/ murein hydrolase activator NlpD